MPLPDGQERTGEFQVSESTGDNRRRWLSVAATVIVGPTILGATLAAPLGSTLFFALGLLAAVSWIVGALLAGPIPLGLSGERSSGVAEVVAALLLGAVLFVAFLVARLVAEQVPVLSDSVARVLARADAGPRLVVLLVALVNGVGEEMFFRGALPTAFGKHHPAVWATALYCVVTIFTLNVALVAAAAVMGTVFMVERRATGGVIAPIITHVTWSTLIIFFLPR